MSIAPSRLVSIHVVVGCSSPHPREIAANYVHIALAARPCLHNADVFLCLSALAGTRDLLRRYDFRSRLSEGLLAGRNRRRRRLTRGQDLNRGAGFEWLGQSVKISADGELTGRPERVLGEIDQAQESYADDRTEREYWHRYSGLI